MHLRVGGWVGTQSGKRVVRACRRARLQSLNPEQLKNGLCPPSLKKHGSPAVRSTLTATGVCFQKASYTAQMGGEAQGKQCLNGWSATLQAH